jgi:hypothetical protein
LKILEPIEPNSEIDSQALAEAVQDIMKQAIELEAVDLRLSNTWIKTSTMKKEPPRQSKITAVRPKPKHDTLPVSLIASGGRREM